MPDARQAHPRRPERPCRGARLRAALPRPQARYNADEIMAEIVAKRLVEHLERAGFVVMQRAPIGGGAALGRGFDG